MRGILTCFLVMTTFSFQLIAQCVSLKEATLVVSDRYTSVTEFNGYLVLANEFGLVYRDLTNPSAPPLAQEAVPGEITEIIEHQGSLYLIAKNEGVYIYALGEGTEAAFPQKRAFFPLPGIQTGLVNGDRLVAVLEDRVALFRLLGKNQTVLLDEFPGKQSKVISSGNLLLLHLDNGPVTILPYSADGFGETSQKLTIDGADIFYGLEQLGDLVLVDAPTGVQWLAFDGAGQVSQKGFYYANANSDVVQGISADHDMLAMRFSDRIDLFKRNPDNRLIPAGSIALTFTQLAFTKQVPVGEKIYLLNTNPRSRDWSMRSYQVESETTLAGEVPAQFGDMVGAASLGGKVFFGTEDRIYLAPENNAQDEKPQLTFDLGEPLISFTNMSNFIVATTIAASSSSTRVTWLDQDESGALQVAYEELFTGAVEQLSPLGEQVAILQHQRKTDGEHYTIHVLTHSNGTWSKQDVEEVFPFQTQEPIRDLQLSSLGVTHHNGSIITVHGNLNNLNQRSTYQPQLNVPILQLASQSDHFWIESREGLQILEPRNQELLLKSKYDHWYNLVNRNNVLLARSSKDRLPSRFHLLELEASGLVQSQVAFSLSGDPLLINQSQNSIITVEKNAFSSFDINCPSQNFNYLIPFASGLEMELNTLGDGGDVITLSIFKEDGQIIGVQSLTPELIDQFNGQQLMEWLFDFNRDEAPFSFVLSASRPITPVISGYATNANSSRFAYTVPPWGNSELLVPHIPQNPAVWSTELFIRNFNESDDTSIILTTPNGERVASTVDSGATQIINVSQDNLVNSSPWARIFSENLDTRLSGFSLYQDLFDQQAAAVPMTSSGSDFLILPSLIGETRDGWWTGLVLANTNGQQVFIRALGYDDEGQILLDRIVEIEENKSLVVIGESWLDGLRKREEVKWLAISAEQPIVGMALFGDSNSNRLAGVPLKSEVGRELQFSGIRSSNAWETSIQVINTGNDRGLLGFMAFDGEGEEVALETREIPPKGLHDESIASLFPSLSATQRASIQAVRVTCTTFISGFMFREQTGANSLEAISPYIPQ